MSKTEHPTPKRLREARARGQVAPSSDLSSAALLLILAALLLTVGPRTHQILMTALRDHIGYAFVAPSLTVGSASSLLEEGIRILLRAIGPLLAVGAVITAAIMFLQVGPLFSLKPISPDLSNLGAWKGMRNRLFSAQACLRLLQTTSKVAIVIAVVSWVLEDSLRDVGLTVRQPVETAAALTGRLLYSITIKAGGSLLLLGVLDLFFQRWQHLRTLRMSKDEIAREHQQQEGDPRHKVRRKQIHREILQHNAIGEVTRADVVILHPGEAAVALRYRKEELGVPQVVATGQRLFANQIVEVARRHRVPIITNASLARALSALEVGDPIPPAQYDAVVEILRRVYGVAGLVEEEAAAGLAEEGAATDLAPRSSSSAGGNPGAQ